MKGVSLAYSLYARLGSWFFALQRRGVDEQTDESVLSTARGAVSASVRNQHQERCVDEGQMGISDLRGEKYRAWCGGSERLRLETHCILLGIYQDKKISTTHNATCCA